jgi:hypothetical protein
MAEFLETGTKLVTIPMPSVTICELPTPLQAAEQVAVRRLLAWPCETVLTRDNGTLYRVHRYREPE